MRNIIQEIFNLFIYEPTDELTARNIEKLVKSSCPGNYEVACSFEDTRPKLKFKFEDPEEAVIFRLKYGYN